MTIYGQNLGVFKRENNECCLNGEKTKLQNHNCSSFEFRMCGLLGVFCHKLRHYEVILT